MDQTPRSESPAMTYTMQETNHDKMHGPFIVRYVMDGRRRERTVSRYRALAALLPVLAGLADRGRVTSIAVLDRYGRDVTFGSDILPLLEDVQVIPTNV